MKKYLLLALLMFSIGSSGQSYIADYTVAKEEVLRSIPEAYIDKARNEFKIAYQHTSHGTHVSYGLYGLPDYKPGDESLFAISRNSIVDNKLALFDNALSSYANPGEDASDLSRNERAFIDATRHFLDDVANDEVNVIMWSWCDIAGHQVEANYLDGMQILIDEYGKGGSKIGSGIGQRPLPVHFIFMTGHANLNNNTGVGKPKNQADLITNYCRSNGYYCLDYYSIDSHCMSDNYYSDCSDDGASNIYGGNFYKDYQNSQSLGHGYYENKKVPAGSAVYGEHNSQHITSNRKAYAMWWILAKLAGWNETATSSNTVFDKGDIHFNQTQKKLTFTDSEAVRNASLRIYNLAGSLVMEKVISTPSFSLRHLKNGLYIVSIAGRHNSLTKKIVIQ